MDVACRAHAQTTGGSALKRQALTGSAGNVTTVGHDRQVLPRYADLHCNIKSRPTAQKTEQMRAGDLD